MSPSLKDCPAGHLPGAPQHIALVMCSRSEMPWVLSVSTDLTLLAAYDPAYRAWYTVAKNTPLRGHHSATPGGLKSWLDDANVF